MSDAARPPDCISLDEHRDDQHRLERAFRWVLLAALTILVLAALAGVFGQRHEDALASAPAARLELRAPGALRSGLLFQGRFRVAAVSELRRPTLVLDDGWFDAVSVNAVVPEPRYSWSEGGRLAFEFPALSAGRTMTVYVDFQMNPTTAGRRDQGVELRDGDRAVAAIHRSVLVFP
jgi:hypothetical protein